MSPKQISEVIGCDKQVIYDLSNRRGWSKLRAKAWSKADKEMTDCLSNEIAQVSHEIATESEELTFGTLQMLRESIDNRNAKDAQAASGAARNLVDIARRSRGLDSNNQQSTASNGSVNFFVLQELPAVPALPVSKPELQVNPAVDVSTKVIQ